MCCFSEQSRIFCAPSWSFGTLPSRCQSSLLHHHSCQDLHRGIIIYHLSLSIKYYLLFIIKCELLFIIHYLFLFFIAWSLLLRSSPWQSSFDISIYLIDVTLVTTSRKNSVLKDPLKVCVCSNTCLMLYFSVLWIII